jgi:hypothetical protein
MPPILAALPGKMPLAIRFRLNRAFSEIFHILFLSGNFIFAQPLLPV